MGNCIGRCCHGKLIEKIKVTGIRKAPVNFEDKYFYKYDIKTGLYSYNTFRDR